jgi:hypothetical protein
MVICLKYERLSEFGVRLRRHLSLFRSDVPSAIDVKERKRTRADAANEEAGTEASPPISNRPLQLKVERALRARC